MKGIVERRSVRLFNEKIISDEDMDLIMEMGIIAPSAHNKQPWEFIVIKKDEIKEDISNLMIEKVIKSELNPKHYEFTKQAIDTCSHLIIVLNVLEINKNNTLSIGACIENMLISASEFGIGSLWIGHTDIIEKELLDMLEESSASLVSVIALGYSDDKIKARPRKRLEDKVRYLGGKND